MRVRIIFKLKNKGAMLPFHHQALIRSLLDMVMGDVCALNDRSFSFSGLKGQTKVGKEGLHYFSKRVTIVFSSSDEALVNLLLQRIFRLPQLYLGSLLLEPEMVEQEHIAMPNGEHRYLCISPIVIASPEDGLKSKEFILPTVDEFSDLLYESTMNRMEASGLYSAQALESFYKFQIVPDTAYLSRLQQQGKKFARIYSVNYEGQLREVRGYTFPFALYAADEVQSFILNNGFGEFSGHGFGMLDCSNAVATVREVLLADLEQGNR